MLFWVPFLPSLAVPSKDCARQITVSDTEDVITVSAFGQQCIIGPSFGS